MAQDNGTSNSESNNSEKIDLNGDMGDLIGASSKSTANESKKEKETSSSSEPLEHPKREENNPFSLKHFLKSDPPNHINGSGGLPATITTSSSPTMQTGGTNDGLNSTTATSNNSFPKGARPKLLQQTDPNQSNKMKRSPRFPSFDSQASLNEYKYDDDLRKINSFYSRSKTSFIASSSSTAGCSGIGGDRDLNESNCDNGNYRHISFKDEYPDFQRSYSSYNLESPKTSPRLDRERASRNNEFPSALPDFVQDHLVVEQLFNAFGGSNSPPASTSPLNYDRFEDDSDLGDALSSVRPEILPSSSCNDIPFDLTYNSTCGGRTSRNRNLLSGECGAAQLNHPNDIPLDLPSKEWRASGRRNLQASDLTLDLTGSKSNETEGGGGGGRNDYHFIPHDHHTNQSSNFDGGKIQILPDFLSDGPIHSSNRLADVAQDLPLHIDSPDNETMSTVIAKLRFENERLRQELDENRRILSERTRRITELERVIENERRNESQYTASLSQSMEQVEENLDRSNKRAAAAQGLANKLRQQVKQLTSELETLKAENEILKEENSGAVGGSGVRAYQFRPLRTRQLSRELLLAASTAENNLRQLLTGVDNLRTMAATIGNIDHPDDRNDPDYISDCDVEEDDCAGPAL